MAVFFPIESIKRRVRQAAFEGAVDEAERILAIARKKILDPPKTGIIYRRFGFDHQSSAPGEAPANLTGDLIRSGKVVIDKENLKVSVEFNTRYANYLEFGTKKMEPRPFLRPATNEARKGITNSIRGKIRDVLLK